MMHHAVKKRFGSPSELSTVSDDDWVARPVLSASWVALDLLDDIHSLNNLTKHHMLSIQPAGHNSCDEELRSCLKVK